MASHHDHPRPAFGRAYGFAIITGALFLLSWIGQFAFQLIEVQNDAFLHGEVFQWSEVFPQFLASTFENWQSEFLQLIWQAAGLSFLLFWGSSQSKESDERLESKIDALLKERGLDPAEISRTSNESM